MKTRIVKIGNSRGIPIPKLLLDQAGIVDDVEIEVEKNQIFIRPISNPRSGWDDAFSTMARNGDDALIEGYEAYQKPWCS